MGVKKSNVILIFIATCSMYIALAESDDFLREREVRKQSLDRLYQGALDRIVTVSVTSCIK